jgi:Leucine-rich repeat (LRR) protein
MTISEFEGLLSLDISRTRMTDLEGISHLRNLKYLTARDTLILDLLPLVNLRSLESLNIEYSRGVTDISPLQTSLNWLPSI